jgi:hypothetical protein
VFDISQTDGQPLPEIGSVNGYPREHRERLLKFVAEQSIALEYSDEIAPARGTSSGGKIRLLPGQSPAEEFATLAHEVAHEMMHRDERRPARRNASARLKPRSSRLSYAAQSASKREAQRSITSACTAAMRSSSATVSNTSSGQQPRFSTQSAPRIPPRRLPNGGILLMQRWAA